MVLHDYGKELVIEKKDLSITEAFELYRAEQIVYKNESARTEVMHGLVLRPLLEFFGGDIPISELIFNQIRKWKEWIQKNKKPNTVRDYIIKLRVVIKHLQLKGYPVINRELGEGLGFKSRRRLHQSFKRPQFD
ncbi:hypothetical protein IKF04_04210 [Candidatus Saccharibacteria bacterium]|nr:hypothetical protein [Candidatus Saccharibacteria bacterium]